MKNESIVWIDVEMEWIFLVVPDSSAREGSHRDSSGIPARVCVSVCVGVWACVIFLLMETVLIGASPSASTGKKKRTRELKDDGDDGNEEEEEEEEEEEGGG